MESNKDESDFETKIGLPMSNQNNFILFLVRTAKLEAIKLLGTKIAAHKLR